MKSLRIGIDLDDVLMEFNQGFYDFYNRKCGISFHPKDQTTFTIRDLLGITKDEEWQYVNEFYDSVDHQKTMPVLGAIEILATLKDHELFLISARPRRVLEVVTKWLDVHFPGAFSQVILTDQYQQGAEPRKSKGEIAQEMSLDLFIEDSLSNAKEIASYGIPVVLLNKYWNQGEVAEGVTRVRDWFEAQEKIAYILK